MISCDFFEFKSIQQYWINQPRGRQTRSSRSQISQNRMMNQYTTQELLLYNFYLYACKTVVFIIIYSSIEITFASIELSLNFDRMNSRSKQPSIEVTRLKHCRKIQGCIDIVRKMYKVCYIDFLLNMSPSKISKSLVIIRKGTLWILSLLTLVFIHVLLMLFWKSLRICFFHI